MSIHGVLSFSVELLDSEILLDGIEKYLDVPSCPVKFRDMVGQAIENIRENRNLVCGVPIF